MGLFIFLLFILLVLGSILILGIIILVALLYFMPRGAPYAVTDTETLEAILRVVTSKKGDKVIDIGSGDGKVVIALAQKGVDAYGIEFNPILVLWSRYKIKQLKLESKARIYWGDMWRHDMGKYDVVIVYGIFYIMKRLEKKLRQELHPGARVIVNHFQFPTWKPQQKKGRMAVYLKT